MSSVGPKQAIFTGLAEVAQALGHAHRLELLEHVAQGIRSVEELSARGQSELRNTQRKQQALDGQVVGLGVLGAVFRGLQR